MNNALKIKIDRAAYFIYEAMKNRYSFDGQHNDMNRLGRMYTMYKALGKHISEYGISFKSPKRIMEMFIALENTSKHRIVTRLYRDNMVNIDCNAEVEWDYTEIETYETELHVENVNSIDLEHDYLEVETDDISDEADEEVRNIGWSIHSVDGRISWDSMDSALVRPSDDGIVMYLEQNPDYEQWESEDIDQFVGNFISNNEIKEEDDNENALNMFKDILKEYQKEELDALVEKSKEYKDGKE